MAKLRGEDISNLGQLFMQGFQFGQGVQVRRFHIQALEGAAQRRQLYESIVSDNEAPADRSEALFAAGLHDEAQDVQSFQRTQIDLDKDEAYKFWHTKGIEQARGEDGLVDQAKYWRFMTNNHPTSEVMQSYGDYVELKGRAIQQKRNKLALNKEQIDFGIQALEKGLNPEAVAAFNLGEWPVDHVVTNTLEGPDGDIKT